MKNLFLTSILMSAALSVSAAYTVGTGQYFEVDELRYEILDPEAKTAAIAGPAETVNDYFYCYCPETVKFEGQDYTVVQINDRAFYNNSSLYYIQFPATLTDIGAQSFSYCTNVYFPELPEGLESIGKDCFRFSLSIESITLPESVVELGEGAFRAMFNLRRVVMQNSAITEIKPHTFFDDKELEEVYLPLTLKKIGDYAFARTLSLTDLYFPEGLESIGNYAFEGQPYDHEGYRGGLESLELPSTLKELGIEAFSPIPAFKVDLSKCTNLKVIPERAFHCCYNITSLTLPEGLEEIGKYAFYSIGANASVGTTSIVIPSSVTTFGEGAFSNTKIPLLKIGDNISTIADNTFDKVTSIEIGKGIKTIGPEAFKKDNLRLIHLHAPTPPTFNHNFNLTETEAQNITVIIPDGSLTVYAYHPKWKQFNLVEESKSQVEITLDGTTGIGEAIYKASGVLPARVTSLKVSGRMTKHDLEVIAKNMFSLSKLDLYNTTGLTEIPASCFADNTLLTEMTLPESIEVIDDCAFSGCTSLRIDKLPNSLKSIGYQSFLGCSSLNITELPEELESLGYGAFSECISLRSITAGSKLTGYLQACFSSCRLLEYVDFSRTKITSTNYLFYICESLKTLLLPNTIRTLGRRDFSITGLRSLTLPGSITDLGIETFYDSPIKALGIGEGIQAVGSGIFQNCSQIVSASLPASTTALGENVFEGCSRLRFISCAAKEAPTTENSSFAGVLTQKSTLTIPSESFFSYLNAPGWGGFGNYEFSLDVSVPDDITVTAVAEEDYEEMAEDEQLENAQLENSVIPGESNNVRARRIKARKQQSSDLLNGKHFAKVFNGASMQSSNDKRLKGTRFFIFGELGKDYSKVLYNDTDVTDNVFNGQIVLPAGAMGTLKIVPAEMSSIETIGSELSEAGSCTVYNLQGIKVADSTNGLAKGVYIVRQGSQTKKISI